MKSLIVCPAGTNLFFHDSYDKENHWRFTDKQEREYETLVICYNDFVPPINTYDYIYKMSGHKWQLIREVPKILKNIGIDIEKYDYIAAVDDDLVTDIDSFNTGIRLAREKDFKLWQLSMIEGSGIIYNCLKQNKNWWYTETNFVEMGSPFFRRDYFLKAIEFFNMLDFTIGWGIDKVFCDVLDITANVVHNRSIYHPPNNIKKSYYDQNVAMEEMNYMISVVYPSIIRYKYNKPDWFFSDKQETLKIYFNEEKY